MNAFELRIDDPIIPGDRLGGFVLRTRVAEIQTLIYRIHWIQQRESKWYDLAKPFDARYRIGPVELCVDIRNGKIFQLNAFEGYIGTLFGSISVGMLVSEAMALERRLYYDEVEERLQVQEVSGVSLEVPEVDPDPQLVPSLPIRAISVFAEEAFNAPAAAEGRW